jgi:putative salt-induced outer membrane protein
MKFPRSAALAAAIVLCAPAIALAAPDNGWNGSGELGLAQSNGNSKSLNVNAKLKLGYESDVWMDSLFLDANRAKSNVKIPILVDGVQTGEANNYETTANHFDAGGSVGYKFNPRAYVVGAARYDRDDFAPNRWQEVASIGFGYILLKDMRSELSFEAGPGYKRYQPQSFIAVDTSVTPPVSTIVKPAREQEAIGRGLVNYKYALTASTSLQETLLAEVGSKNKYYQNDIGLAVAMTKTLALKVAYEHRYNSNIVPGTKHLDSLFTTNLVYSFGKQQ